MSTTDNEARDIINAIADVAWSSAAALAAIETGTLGAITWDGKTEKEKPSGIWARVNQSIVSQRQASMSDDNAYAGKRRFETVGFVTVQLFFPAEIRNSARKLLALAAVVRDAYRTAGATGTVWFVNSRSINQPDEGSSHRRNVIAEFSYDTIA